MNFSPKRKSMKTAIVADCLHPRLALRRCAAFHRLLTHQYINQAAVPLEVPAWTYDCVSLAGMIFA